MPVSQDSLRRWTGVARVKGPLWAKMPLLALSSLGIAVHWSMAMGNVPPYLASLGLSKSSISVVLIAGPLSGLVVQPLVGILSDTSASRFGRRRPFIVIGCIICFFFFYLLGFSAYAASILVSSKEIRKNIAIFFAAFSFYVLDFSINAIMASHRALLVDILPVSEQDTGSAWVGRMGAVGNLLGFLVGNLSLPKLFPFLGNTQMQVVVVFTSILVLLSNGITVLSVQERILVGRSKRPENVWKSVKNTVKELWMTTLNLPPVIRQICVIQFVCWLAWLPLFNFGSLWVSNLYYNENPRDPLDVNNEAGMRAANRALLYSSIVSMICAVIMPFFVDSSASTRDIHRKDDSNSWLAETRWKMHSCSFWALSQGILAFGLGVTWFVNSVSSANLVMAVLGAAPSISSWAPYAVLGEAIHTAPTSSLAHTPLPPSANLDSVQMRDFSSAHQQDPLKPPTNSSDETVGQTGIEQPPHNMSVKDMNEEVEPFMVLDEYGSEGTVQDKAGTIFGIQTVFIVTSQFLATGFASVVFALTDARKSRLVNELDDEKEPFDSIGFLLRLGAVCAAVASYMCWRLSRQLRA